MKSMVNQRSDIMPTSTEKNRIRIYNERMFDLIHNANREIYLAMQKSRYPKIIFRKGTNNVIIKADEQRLQTFFTRGGFDNWINRRRHLKLDNSRGITKWLKSFFKNAA